MNTEPCTCTHNANSKIINSKNAIVMKYSQAWVNRLKVMKLRQVWFPIPTTAVYGRESMVAVILLITSIANLWTTEDQWIRSHVDITNGLLLCRFSLDENFHYHLFMKYCWCRILWSLLSVACGYCLRASAPMWTSLWMKTFTIISSWSIVDVGFCGVCWVWRVGIVWGLVLLCGHLFGWKLSLHSHPLYQIPYHLFAEYCWCSWRIQCILCWVWCVDIVWGCRFSLDENFRCIFTPTTRFPLIPSRIIVLCSWRIQWRLLSVVWGY